MKFIGNGLTKDGYIREGKKMNTSYLALGLVREMDAYGLFSSGCT